MKISLLLLLFFAQQVLCDQIKLVKGRDGLLSAIENRDSKGNAILVDYINADHTESVDNFGEFSPWSNAFLTVKPGQKIRFPKNVDTTYPPNVNANDNTFLVSSTMHEKLTSIQLTPIESTSTVYVCFRSYTKDNNIHVEVSLRRPDGRKITDQILEQSYEREKKFKKNKYGGFESVWPILSSSNFEIYKDQFLKAYFAPSRILANSNCHVKQNEGNIHVMYNHSGITYTIRKPRYV